MTLDDLRTFVRVAEVGTFSEVARRQGVPKSTVSRRVARLEDSLGVELIRRAPRSFRLTADGQALYERSKPALTELVDLVRHVSERGGEPRGKLVITAAPDLGTTSPVLDLLARYSRHYPGVVVEVRLLDRMVDLPTEGVDIAIRAHGGAIPGAASLMSRNVGRLSSRLYASSSYLDQHGRPDSPSALGEHFFVAHSSLVRRTFTMTHASGATYDLQPSNVVAHGNSMTFVRGLAERGLGMVLLPDVFGFSSVQRGVLQPVLADWSAQTGQMTLVWPSSRHLAPAVRGFVELARDLTIEAPEPPPCDPNP